MIKRYYFVTIEVSPASIKKRIKEGKYTFCSMLLSTRSFFEDPSGLTDYALKIANKEHYFDDVNIIVKSISRI